MPDVKLLPDVAWAVVARGERLGEGILVWSVPEGAELKRHVYGLYRRRSDARAHAKLYGGRVVEVRITEAPKPRRTP